MKTNMQKKEGRYVITLKTSQCCRVDGGKKRYYFCDDSTSLISEMIRLIATCGDNYYCYEISSQDELEGLDVGVAELPENYKFPIYMTSGGGDIELRNFDDELDLANYLCGDYGDHSLRFDEDADCDLEEKIEILKAENKFYGAIQGAFENLWQ